MKKGFTLIEILVVISIIGLLASIILTSLHGATEKAKIAVAQSDLRQIADAIIYARLANNLRAREILGSDIDPANDDGNQDDCYANHKSGSIGLVGDLPDSDICVTEWVHDLGTFQTYTGKVYLGLTNLVRDPWGDPYQFDADEGQFPKGDTTSCPAEDPSINPRANHQCYCRPDRLFSAGPDKMWHTADDIGLYNQFDPTAKIYFLPFVDPYCG